MDGRKRRKREGKGENKKEGKIKLVTGRSEAAALLLFGLSSNASQFPFFLFFLPPCPDPETQRHSASSAREKRQQRAPGNATQRNAATQEGPPGHQ
jgi:hypothetical protein